ncbi:MAG: hypothetical protein LBR20_02330 [Propionibacteriaceae bacterium]|jgi:hypothetical protein|nr:hypothetical protein [Propionibacteriaceae bacterium]
MEIINYGVVVPSHQPVPAAELALALSARPFNVGPPNLTSFGKSRSDGHAGGSAFDPVEEPTPKSSHRKKSPTWAESQRENYSMDDRKRLFSKRLSDFSLENP